MAGFRSVVPMALALALALVVAGAGAGAAEPEIAAQVVTQDHYPPREVMFPGGVRGIAGAVYATLAGYRPLTLDLYLPPRSLARPAGGFPLVVYIHGGGWFTGDARHGGAFVDFPGVLAAMAARGYVVASVEYRLSGEAVFPAPIQDVKAAIRWLRAHAAEYGANPARAVAWGVSAGGHLAALAATTCGVAALEPRGGAPAGSDCVQAGVIWYGVFDFATIQAQAHQAHALPRDSADAPEWRMLGCFAAACAPGRIAAASPVDHVDAHAPPMLLIAGAEDRTVPVDQSREMADRLASAGVPHELMVLPGIDHSLIGQTPEQTRAASLAALEATQRFIDRTLGAAGP